MGLALCLLPSSRVLAQGATLDSGATMEIVGTGTESLLGGDLTDPENDGDEAAGPEDPSWNWKSITSNDEPGFEGGEFSYNVFDNILAGGNGKWCCNDATEEAPKNITVEFAQPYRLTHFTVSSANDVPDRDPLTWKIQGSNDGITFENIFTHDNDESQWTTVRFQVNKYTLTLPAKPYKFIRFEATRTAGALYQVGEIEYFGLAGLGVPKIEILGKGQAFLIGSDLTDPENDGNEANGPTDPSWNWESITSTNEPGFGGGEFSYNIFDNLVGGGNNKWCCDDPTEANPHRVDVKFRGPVSLRHFTITSGNDARDREPLVWQIAGSNDGVAYTPIFVQNDLTKSIWTDTDQVAKVTLPIPSPNYRYLRFQVSVTAGPLHQLGEIEYFGDFAGLPSIGKATATTNTVSVTITDSATGIVDVTKPRSMKIGGLAVTPVTIAKVADVTTLSYTSPTAFTPGVLLSVEPSVTTVAGLPVTGVRTVRAPYASNINGGGTFVTQHIYPNGSPQMNDADGVLAALEDPSAIPAEDQLTTTTQYIHFNDNVGAPWHEPLSKPFPLFDPDNGGSGPGDRNDFAIRGKAKISIRNAGKCWFICNSDDGFVLKIDDVEIGRAGNRGRGNTVMSVNLTAGLHDLDFIFWERGGGAGCTLYVHMGVSDVAPPENAESYELLRAFPLPGGSPTLGLATVAGNTVSVTIKDSATGIVDITKARSLKIGGVVVTPTTISKTGDLTTLSYTSPTAFGPGVVLSLEPTVTTVAGATVTGTRAIRTPFVSNINAGGTFRTQHIYTRGNPQMNDDVGVLAALDDPSAIPAVDQITANTRYIHFNDNVGAPWHEPLSKPFPLFDPVNGGTGLGDRDDFAIRSKGKISIKNAGKCWFICNSDDGFVLKIDDVEIGRAGNRGRGNTVMSVDLKAGLHDFDFIFWERGGGAGCTVYVHMGVSENAPPESAESYELLQAAPAPAAVTDVITSITPSGNNLVIAFTPTVPAAYKLSRSLNMLTWTTLGDVAVIAGGNITFTTPKPAGEPRAYYRIVK